MSQPALDVANLREPVEMLLRRIASRALCGPLVTGAALAAGCSATDPNGDLLEQAGGAVFGEARDARVAAGDGGAPRERDAAASDAAAPSDPNDYDPCSAGAGFPVRASGLKPAEPQDYVAVREANGSRGSPDAEPVADGWGTRPFELLSETGQACASASNDACRQKVALHPQEQVESYCVQVCVEWSVVTTRGDEVKRSATPEELVQLLGAIDSVDEALMVAASRAYDISCRQAGGPIEESKEAWRRSVRPVADGYEVLATRYAETCPVLPRRYRLLVTKDGEVRELESIDFPLPMNVKACIGRLPAGLASPRAQPPREDFGAYLARCAHLEAASVYAFARLAEELAAHGAPEQLRSRARAAADDEVRHARTVAALSRAHGGEPEPAEVAALATRSLEAMATENAVEGCVRETYGALVGLHQAERAGELALRHEMRAIADDELRHASLSHDVHAWLMAQLDDAARARVHAAQRAAIEALVIESAWEPEPVWAGQAGLPSAQLSSRMLAELDSSLWEGSVRA